MTGGQNSTKCGTCTKAAIHAARQGHVYVRTHVHVAPDGSKSIESGPPCPGDNLPDQHPVTIRRIDPKDRKHE
jgi:hypothetical protein